MTATIQSLGIDRLPLENRMKLVYEIWDSIAAETTSNLCDAQRQELRRRVEEDDANPEDTIGWDEAFTRALNSIRK